MLFFLIADLNAIVWAALWEGAVAKDSRTAASNAQAKVLLLPWLPMVLGAFLVDLFGWVGVRWFALCVLVLGSLLADNWFTKRARQNLLTLLPERARSRAAGEIEYYGTWAGLGRRLGRLWRSTFISRRTGT